MSQLPQAATSDAQQPAVSRSRAMPGVMPAASCVQEHVSPEPTTTPSEGMPQAPMHPAKDGDAPNSKAGQEQSPQPKSRHRSQLFQRLPGSEGKLAARLAGPSSSGSSRAQQCPDAGKTLLRASGSVPADERPGPPAGAAEGSQGPKLSAEQEPPQLPDATADAGRDGGLSATRGSPQPSGPPAVASSGSTLLADQGPPQPAGRLPLGKGSAQPAEVHAQADQGHKSRLLRLPGGVEQTVLSNGNPCNTPDMLRPPDPARLAAGPDLQAGSASQAPGQAAEASQQATAPGETFSSNAGVPRQGLKHAAGYRRKRCAAESPRHASEGDFSIPAAWGRAGRQQSPGGLQERVAPDDQEHTAAIRSHSALQARWRSEAVSWALRAIWCGPWTASSRSQGRPQGSLLQAQTAPQALQVGCQSSPSALAAGQPAAPATPSPYPPSSRAHHGTGRWTGFLGLTMHLAAAILLLGTTTAAAKGCLLCPSPQLLLGLPELPLP